MKLFLSGNWSVKNEQKQIVGVVPGDLTNDFYKAGIITNPYYDEDYKNAEWIVKSDWTYEKKFNVNLCDLSDNAFIVFEGIDTFSDIYLNGVYLGSTCNMHKGYSFEVKDKLKNGENTLTVNLKNVYDKLGKTEQDKYTCIFNANRLFIRKAQCHFGWDWAPKFPGYGIYREVTLVSESKTCISNVFVNANDKGQATFRIQFAKRFKGEIEVIIKKDGKEIVKEVKKVDCKKFLINLFVNNAMLWWPNGYGEQPLYEYVICQKTEDGKIESQKSGRFAFRSITLDQSPINKDNLNFAILVNGKRIFCRGSNWVPAECMTGTISEQRYNSLLLSAKNANINMLRVWGGGIYESNCFYDYCDQYGIMVWQEFMFACSEIPDDDANFVNEIIEEAVYQLQRLQNHPSIVIWSGMNEVRGSFNEHEEERYGINTLHYLLRGVVNNFSPQTPYIRCSPFAFADTENDISEGDCHNNLSERCLFSASFKGFEDYEYQEKEQKDALSSRLKNYERYVLGTENNFTSECAVLGFCNYESLVKFTPEQKNSLDSTFFEERFLGNPYTYVMPTFFERQKVIAEGLFGKPTSVKDLAKKANRAQAEIIKTEIIYARTNGRSNGFLNWMYNDVWPTGTWSVIDYYLSKKPAYYAIKRTFSPVMVEVCRIGDDYLLCVAVNNFNELLVNFEVQLKEYNGNVKGSKKISGVVSANKPFTAKIDLPVNDSGYYFASGSVGDKEYFAVCDLGRFSEKEFKVDFTTNVKKQKDNEYLVTISANTYLPCLKIWAGESAEIEDNYFDMGAGEQKTVKVLTNASANEFVFTSFFDEWNK